MAIWKFGITHVETELMLRHGFAYAHGGSMPTYFDKKRISEINIGDIIVLAGGTENNIIKIGISTSTSLYCNHKNNKINFKNSNMKELKDQKLLSILKRYEDIVLVMVDWFKGDTSKIKGSYNYIGFSAINVEPVRTNILKYYEKEILEYRSMKLIDETIKLLKANKNLILTGAPGTGKTYLAKQIASQITGSDVKGIEQSGQYDFVQFHPSYDYTDFVEGLRPIKEDGDKEIGFELKNGIFKEFCLKARNNFIDSQKEISTISKEKWLDAKFLEFVDLVQEKIDNNDADYLTLTEAASIVAIDNDAFRYNGENWNYTSLLRMKFQDLKQFYLADVKTRQDIKKNEEASGLAKQHATYFLKAYEKFLNYIGKESPPKKNTESKVELKKYVFVIDEINRGEISKIFGELFFSIDPGYRGESGKVKTQYGNMQDEDYFYVPENVYIIGTMNDIDRSVESFDFAMRRRFVWKEIKAEDTQNMLDSIADIIDVPEAKKRMNSLNAEIEKMPELGSHYQIGAAYFLKLANYNGDFNRLWDLHLKPLLSEYLRGLQGSESKLKELQKAYEADN